MTTNDFDRSLDNWFDSVEPRAVPREILPTVFATTRQLGQRRGFIGRVKQLARVDPVGERLNRFVLVVGSAATLAVAVVGAAYLYGLGQDVGVAPVPTASPSPAPVTWTLPAAQAAVITRHVAAVNIRDAEEFVGAFAADGGFAPRGDFRESSSLFANSLPIADRPLVEVFLAINGAWRFEAEVVFCEELGKSEYARRHGLRRGSSSLYAHCSVKSRWPALSLEIGESWFYEFSGTEITWWGQAVRDATPADRALPLGLDGLLKWESWLTTTDADAAARLLNRREYPVTVPCGAGDPPCEWSFDDVDVQRIIDGTGTEHDWVVAGHNFSPRGLIPYDPARVAEIEASIQEYVRMHPVPSSGPS